MYIMRRMRLHIEDDLWKELRILVSLIARFRIFFERLFAKSISMMLWDVRSRYFLRWAFGRIGPTFPIPNNISEDFGRVNVFDGSQAERRMMSSFEWSASG